MGEAAIHLSVIIATHDRPGTLARAVRSAIDVDYPRSAYEVVVVDNASTQETADVVEETQAAPGGGVVRYVREERLGLHYARHAGAAAARGEVLLFSDDDATFSPRWADAYGAAFRTHPEMAAAGGPVRAAWDAPPPQWLVEFIDSREGFVGGPEMFGPLSLLDRSGDLRIEANGYFFGVNMAIRRDVLYEVGGFNPEAYGDTWLGDGETGLVHKLWARGLPVGYVPDAEVHHHIPPERMTVGYLRRRWTIQGACETYTQFHAGVPGRTTLVRRALGAGARAARLRAKAWRCWNSTDPASLQTQMEASRATRQLTYTARLIFDRRRRELVERDNWIDAPDQTGIAAG